MLLYLESGTRRGAPSDRLTLFAMPATQARYEATGLGPDAQSEGAEYEVAYRLAGPTEAGPIGRSGSVTDSQTGVVWRRLDPVPDAAWDAGGVVFPVVDGVTSLSIEAFDGSAWFSEWDSDRDGLPHAVRIVVEASAAGRRGEVSATARRVVALDRTPTPFVTLPRDERREQATEAAAAQEQGGG